MIDHGQSAFGVALDIVTVLAFLGVFIGLRRLGCLFILFSAGIVLIARLLVRLARLAAPVAILCVLSCCASPPAENIAKPVHGAWGALNATDWDPPPAELDVLPK
jgi:hypothetical protein